MGEEENMHLPINKTNLKMTRLKNDRVQKYERKYRPRGVI